MRKNRSLMGISLISSSAAPRSSTRILCRLLCVLVLSSVGCEYTNKPQTLRNAPAVAPKAASPRPKHEESAPKIAFSCPENLPVVREGEKVNLTFKIWNRGGENLVIGDVKTACGCTPATLVDSIVPPGVSTTLAVRANTSGRQGEMRVRVFLECNDPVRPTAILEASVFVQSNVLLKPRHVDFGSRRWGEQAKTSLTIETVGERPIEIIDIRIPENYLHASVKGTRMLPASYEGSVSDNPRLEPQGMIRKQFFVELTADPPPIQGNFGGLFSVRTESDRKRQIYASYGGAVMGSVDAVPTYCDFGVLSPGMSRETSLTLVVNGKGEIPQIRSIDVGDLPISWRAGRRGFSKQVLEFTLALPKSYRDEAEIFGEVKIFFHNPKEPSLRLNVMCRPKI